jgi:hypothetical protein
LFFPVYSIDGTDGGVVAAHPAALYFYEAHHPIRGAGNDVYFTVSPRGTPVSEKDVISGILQKECGCIFSAPTKL